MQHLETVTDGAQAVARFAIALKARAPMRIDARWDGADGIETLNAVDAALDGVWPSAPTELVWAMGPAATGGSVLRLQARGADGAVLEDAGFVRAA